MPIQKIRDTKLSDNFVGLVEIQQKNWQYMIESFVGSTETFYLKEKIILKELKTLKEIEKKYKIYRRMYNTIYKAISKNFREYLWILEFDEVEELNLHPTSIFYIQIVPTGVRVDPTQNLTVNWIIKQ